VQHVRLGASGLQVSRLCLGTMTFGYQCDEETSFAILDAAADGGITFIDTADSYPLGGGLEYHGRTEEIIGRWLHGQREQYVVATKCYGVTGDRPWQRGLSRKHILSAIDASLRRLGTDYVDLYQMHFPDWDTPLDESLSAMEDVVRAGKARYIGCSNFPAYRVARALGRAELHGWQPVASVQPRYNLLFRQFERDLLPLCAEEGLGVIPYNPIAGGMLTGKHQPGQVSGGRFTLGSAGPMYQDRYWHDSEFETVGTLTGLAADAGVPLTTLAVSWVLANPVITAPIIGASQPGQLADSLRAAEYVLDPGLKEQLDKLTLGYRKGDAVR
jgi:aryl-alcohol dehydrogenase-like predicted oxidoreductase